MSRHGIFLKHRKFDWISGHSALKLDERTKFEWCGTVGHVYEIGFSAHMHFLNETKSLVICISYLVYTHTHPAQSSGIYVSTSFLFCKYIVIYTVFFNSKKFAQAKKPLDLLVHISPINIPGIFGSNIFCSEFKGRALMTSNIAYAHLINQVPFIAHEGCKAGVFRETSGAKSYLWRRDVGWWWKLKWNVLFLGGKWPIVAYSI